MKNPAHKLHVPQFWTECLGSELRQLSSGLNDLRTQTNTGSQPIAQQIPHEPLCWEFWHMITAQTSNKSYIMTMNTIKTYI